VTNDSVTLLKIDNISKRFGDTEAIKDLSLEINRGEIFTLLGPSGCGKSTTLRMIAGLENPDSGEISLNGELIVDTGARKFTPPEKRNMGMVFQSFAVWPHMTVFDNIAFPLRIRRDSRASIRKKAMDALDLVGLADRAQEYPWQLSGGMQQRVALARAIVYSPDLLLLDEPLSNLDAKLREQMRDELRGLQRKLGTTFVFVTHDQDEAMALSTRIAVMNNGSVEHIGTPVEVYERPATAFVRDFLGQTVLLAGTFRHQEGGCCVVLDLGARVPVAENGAAYAPGARVTLACRAEGIRLRPGTDGGEDCIAAVIEDATYIGDRVDYVVRAGGMGLNVCCHDGDRYAVGARVTLEFARKGISVWPDGE
jgi:iron(III) transport system ATP-binding protein